MVAAPELDEASGLAASRRHPGILWAHNDSGDEARLFAVGGDGGHLGMIRLASLGARDWEDIATGPGPDPNLSYLYIGDIGDNDAVYDIKTIVRVPEPALPATVPFDSVLTGWEQIRFQYPDGNRDAETLLVDPLTGDVYIVSKREAAVRVYQLPFPQYPDSTVTATHVATLQETLVVGGDISADGTEILMKTYERVLYWCRQSGQTVADALGVAPLSLPYVLEAQGEAICWDAQAQGYFTTSEEPLGIPARLTWYGRSAATAVEQVEAAIIPGLMRAFPNPFNPRTAIEFTLAVPGRVGVEIFDAAGRRVDVLPARDLSAGMHRMIWDAGARPSGTYFCTIIAGGERRTVTLTLLR